MLVMNGALMCLFGFGLGAPISHLDAIQFGNSCIATGWCSGPGYSGSSLEVRVLIDGDEVTREVANVHRAKAGDHGFEVTFDCSAYETGMHRMHVECLDSTTSAWFGVSGSPFCAENASMSSCGKITATLHNDKVRLAVDGSYVDAHDGLIIEHNGVYFLYGEAYGTQTMAEPYPWSSYPKLSVYTSTDLMNWSYRGAVVPDSFNTGTFWIPNVFYHKASQRFIMWCAHGGWMTATSTDGINFTPVNKGMSGRFGAKAKTDGTGIFVDDDGQGYIIYAANPEGLSDHLVSIEKLSPDLLSVTHVNVSGLFPDDYVESPALFKRKAWYYVTYGSCCCGCKGGGGIVVFKAKSVLGPWVRQSPHSDINCGDAKAPICGAYGRRKANYDELVFNAQWWGPSFIPLASGETAIMYVGRRWLSGKNSPQGCDDICGNHKYGNNRSACVAPDYELRSDLSVWYPLEFDEATGDILPMKPLPTFQLDLPDDSPPKFSSKMPQLSI